MVWYYEIDYNVKIIYLTIFAVSTKAKVKCGQSESPRGLTLHCEAHGIPRPSVEWFSEGKRLPSVEKDVQMPLLRSSSLTVTTPLSRGYEVRISNKASQVSASIVPVGSKHLGKCIYKYQDSFSEISQSQS